MPRHVDKAAIKRSAARSTKASARLEHRIVPAGFVRSEGVERFLESLRRARAEGIEAGSTDLDW